MSNQQNNDPDNLRYCAPRRPSNRPGNLRVTKLWSGEERRSIPTASLQRASYKPPAYGRDSLPYDRGSLSAPLPEVLRRPEPGDMEALLRSTQRARKNQVFALGIRFAVVAALAAGIAFLYVVNFTGLPNLPAAAETADTSNNAAEIVIENGDAAKAKSDRFLATPTEAGNPPPAMLQQNAVLFQQFMQSQQQTAAERDEAAAQDVTRRK